MEPTTSVNKDEPVDFKRLHPFTVLSSALNGLFGLLFMGVFLSISLGPMRALMIAGGLYGLNLIRAAIHYSVFRYGLGKEELILRSGLIEKKERRIPFERIQDIQFEQRFLNRVLGLVNAQVETAGGAGEAEAQLSVITLTEAESIRQEIFQNRQTAIGSNPEGAETPIIPPPLPGEAEGTLLRKVSIGELLIGGFTSQIVATIGAIATFYPSVFLLPMLPASKMVERVFGESEAVKQVVEEIEKAPRGPQIPEIPEEVFKGPVGQKFEKIYALQKTAGGALTLLMGGLVISLISYFFHFYGFELRRVDQQLVRTYGLLTRHRSGVKRRRIQLLRIDEPLLRRLFRMGSLRVDTASVNIGSARSNSGILIPIAPMKELTGLALQALPGLAELPSSWTRVSPKAILRGVRKTGIILAMIVALTWIPLGSASLWIFLLLIPALIYHYFVYRNTGYHLDDDYFAYRQGWWNRTSFVVPIRTIQTTAVERSFFDRRLGLSRLLVNTAGVSGTGGIPFVFNLPAQEADRLARVLSHGASKFAFSLDAAPPESFPDLIPEKSL